jgi:hypothetical protein
MVVLIDKKTIDEIFYKKLRCHLFDYSFYVDYLGIEYFKKSTIERQQDKRCFHLLDKDKLAWAMMKYGFEIELYSN